MGMVRVDGDLDPETGETLLTALRAVLDSESRSGDEPEGRTPAQRRADALGEVGRQWLDNAERPSVAGPGGPTALPNLILLAAGTTGWCISAVVSDWSW
jgi:hypothetical protein